MIARLKRTEPVKRLGLGLLAAAAMVTLVGSLNQHPGLDFPNLVQRTFIDLYSNLGSELASIALTILIIDQMYRHRAIERHKQTLVLQMGSPNHSFAIEAVRMLSAQGWLNHGTLRGAVLNHANLAGANLQRVNLEGARLALTNLHRVDLDHANLRRAYLQGANLDAATLIGADLSSANLNDAELVGVKVDKTTRFDAETILPDCTYWTPGTDMQRFTDPQHADFWRSHNPSSPACHPKNQR